MELNASLRRHECRSAAVPRQSFLPSNTEVPSGRRVESWRPRVQPRSELDRHARDREDTVGVARHFERPDFLAAAQAGLLRHVCQGTTTLQTRPLCWGQLFRMGAKTPFPIWCQRAARFPVGSAGNERRPKFAPFAHLQATKHKREHHADQNAARWH